MAEQLRNLRDLEDEEIMSAAVEKEAFVVSDYRTGGDRVIEGPELIQRLNFLREGILWGRDTREAADLIHDYLKSGRGTRETVATIILQDTPHLVGVDWVKAWRLVEARQAMAQDPANRLES